MESKVVIPRPPPLPPPPTPPCILGKYQLVRFLGRGSFAKVYEARSLVDNTAVAIKMIDKSKTIAASMEPRIIREIDAMRRLQQHPNILKIFEVLASKTKIYLVVELASGGELFSQIARKGRLPEPKARRYFQQLVSALRFCHENGVAHRDIKPQNLLLGEDGNLKVSDFGLSALPEQIQNGLLQTACGTPAYTAPEVFRRRGYEGSKADAWSCGVILFVLLAGFLPFDDSNLATMYKKTNRREYALPDYISKPARYIISQLLDPNPKTRMSIEILVQSTWFKKSLKLKSQGSLLETELNAKRNPKPVIMPPGLNAFEIISMSSGLDLRGLFETKATMSNRKEKRFTSKASMEAVMEKARAIGGELGYIVEKGKDERLVGLGKGKVVLIIEAQEIVPELLLVAVKVVDGGVEFDEFHWGDLKAGLQDVVLSWHIETA